MSERKMDKYVKLINICEANDCFNEEHDCDHCIFNKIPAADVQPTEYVNELIEQLKEAKRLLRLAVEDFSEIYDHIYDCDRLCETCILSGERDHCYKWRYTDEAMKLLIKKEGSTND